MLEWSYFEQVKFLIWNFRTEYVEVYGRGLCEQSGEGRQNMIDSELFIEIWTSTGIL